MLGAGVAFTAGMRFIRRTLWALLAAVLVFHIGGGWYFADQFRNDALDVRHKPLERDLTVVAVSADGRSITLKDPAPPSLEVRSQGDFALAWPKGFGRVSGAARIDGNLVTRDWTPESGTPTTGLKVAVNQDDLAGDQPPGQPVSYSSPLGSMTARLQPGVGTTWAVLVHGKGAHPSEMARMARVTAGDRLPTLIINYRNDEGLPEDPTGHYRYGVTEWRDLKGALDFARGKGAQKYILGGNSMGGGIVASYLKNTHDPDVIGAVLDAPMLDLEATVEWGAAHRTLPGTSIALPDTLTWTAEQIASARFDDVSWSATDYLSDTSWVAQPVLIVHGTKDLTVPLSTSQALAKAEPRRVHLVEFPGAGHCQSWNFDPSAYEAAISTFLTRVTG